MAFSETVTIDPLSVACNFAVEADSSSSLNQILYTGVILRDFSPEGFSRVPARLPRHVRIASRQILRKLRMTSV